MCQHHGVLCAFATLFAFCISDSFKRPTHPHSSAIVRVKLLPSAQPLQLKVNGDVAAMGDVSMLQVTFTDFEVQMGAMGSLAVPLPRPVGTLRSTYCDDDLRISRGGRGGIFVLRRLQSLLEEEDSV